jgi:hypothetical protein
MPPTDTRALDDAELHVLRDLGRHWAHQRPRPAGRYRSRGTPTRPVGRAA